MVIDSANKHFSSLQSEEKEIPKLMERKGGKERERQKDIVEKGERDRDCKDIIGEIQI